MKFLLSLLVSFYGVSSLASTEARVDRLEKIVALQHAKMNEKRKIKIIDNAGSYTTDTMDQCVLTNIPAGLYKVTLIANFVRIETNGEAKVRPRFNNENHAIVPGSSWVLGFANTSFADETEGSTLYSTSYIYKTLTQAQNRFHVDIFTTNARVSELYCMIEEVSEKVEFLTTEWD